MRHITRCSFYIMGEAHQPTGTFGFKGNGGYPPLPLKERRFADDMDAAIDPGFNPTMAVRTRSIYFW